MLMHQTVILVVVLAHSCCWICRCLLDEAHSVEVSSSNYGRQKRCHSSLSNVHITGRLSCRIRHDDHHRDDRSKPQPRCERSHNYGTQQRSDLAFIQSMPPASASSTSRRIDQWADRNHRPFGDTTVSSNCMILDGGTSWSRRAKRLRTAITLAAVRDSLPPPRTAAAADGDRSNGLLGDNDSRADGEEERKIENKSDDDDAGGYADNNLSSSLSSSLWDVPSHFTFHINKFFTVKHDVTSLLDEKHINDKKNSKKNGRERSIEQQQQQPQLDLFNSSVFQFHVVDPKVLLNEMVSIAASSSQSLKDQLHHLPAGIALDWGTAQILSWIKVPSGISILPLPISPEMFMLQKHQQFRQQQQQQQQQDASGSQHVNERCGTEQFSNGNTTTQSMSGSSATVSSAVVPVAFRGKELERSSSNSHRPKDNRSGSVFGWNIVSRAVGFPKRQVQRLSSWKEQRRQQRMMNTNGGVDNLTQQTENADYVYGIEKKPPTSPWTSPSSPLSLNAGSRKASGVSETPGPLLDVESNENFDDLSRYYSRHGTDGLFQQDVQDHHHMMMSSPSRVKSAATSKSNGKGDSSKNGQPLPQKQQPQQQQRGDVASSIYETTTTTTAGHINNNVSMGSKAAPISLTSAPQASNNGIASSSTQTYHASLPSLLTIPTQSNVYEAGSTSVKPNTGGTVSQQQQPVAVDDGGSGRIGRKPRQKRRAKGMGMVWDGDENDDALAEDGFDEEQGEDSDDEDEEGEDEEDVEERGEEEEEELEKPPNFETFADGEGFGRNVTVIGHVIPKPKLEDMEITVNRRLNNNSGNNSSSKRKGNNNHNNNNNVPPLATAKIATTPTAIDNVTTVRAEEATPSLGPAQAPLPPRIPLRVRFPPQPSPYTLGGPADRRLVDIAVLAASSASSRHNVEMFNSQIGLSYVMEGVLSSDKSLQLASLQALGSLLDASPAIAEAVMDGLESETMAQLLSPHAAVTRVSKGFFGRRHVTKRKRKRRRHHHHHHHHHKHKSGGGVPAHIGLGIFRPTSGGASPSIKGGGGDGGGGTGGKISHHSHAASSSSASSFEHEPAPASSLFLDNQKAGLLTWPHFWHVVDVCRNLIAPAFPLLPCFWTSIQHHHNQHHHETVDAHDLAMARNMTLYPGVENPPVKGSVYPRQIPRFDLRSMGIGQISANRLRAAGRRKQQLELEKQQHHNQQQQQQWQHHNHYYQQRPPQPPPQQKRVSKGAQTQFVAPPPPPPAARGGEGAQGAPGTPKADVEEWGLALELQETAIALIYRLCLSGDDVIERVRATPHVVRAIHKVARESYEGKFGRYKQGRLAPIQRLAYKVLAMLGENIWVPKSPGQKGLRVLCFDGGGTRGVVTVQLLKKLTQLTGKEPTEMFDLMIGTSTGGIIAALVGIQGYTVKTCEQMYDALIKDIFVKHPGGGVKLALKQAFYDEANWMKILTRIIGDQKMIDSADDPLRPKVSFPSTVISVNPSKLFLWRNYNYPVGVTSRYTGAYRAMVRESIRATTAAPTFFSPLLKEGALYSDGALIANNPTCVALHEARKIFPDIPIEMVVSLGTGCFYESKRDFSDPGIGWDGIVNQLISSATETEITHDILTDMLPEEQYFRFNPRMGTKEKPVEISIDETRHEKLTYLKKITVDYFKDPAVKERLEVCAEILKT